MKLKPTTVLMVMAFIAGCASTFAFSVPVARAEQQPIKKWEHWCRDIDGVPTNEQLSKAGEEGWELVSSTFRPPVVQNGNSVGGGATFLCFKRPK